MTKSKKEEKVKVGPHTRRGRRVKQFTRRQKIAAGTTALTGVAALAIAVKRRRGIGKLVKNAKSVSTKPNKPVANLYAKISADQVVPGNNIDSIINNLTKNTLGFSLEDSSITRQSISKIKDGVSNTIGEYDHFILKIPLSKTHPGLQVNANPVDRMDALKNIKKLISDPSKIEISPRLTPSSKTDIGFYS